MKNKIIICLSNQFYNSPFKTNKRLVMDELAKRGNKVVFVNPPTRFLGLKRLLKGKRGLVEKKSDNLYVYTPINLFNFFPFSWFSNIFHSLMIKKVIKGFPRKSASDSASFSEVLWTYHFDFPRVFDLYKSLNPNVFIYDVVDDYESFPEYSKRDIKYKKHNFLIYFVELVDRFFKELIDQKGKRGKEWVRYREKELAERSDIVFSSHPVLFEKFKGIVKNKSKVFYTPNAGRFYEFKDKPKELPEKLNVKKPRVLYVGALDSYKFDVDLFLHTAKNSPNINYTLIGKLNVSDSNPKVQKLLDLKNVIFAGPVNDADKYAHFYDAYIIPYQVNDYTYKGCFPIKFFNALSTGVPVVVTNLPCYNDYKDVLYIAENKEEFLELVKKSVKDKDESKRKERIKTAKENTWEKKVDKQMEAIDRYLDNKISG